eukprot:2887086-Pyramimonas_sp.AAC.1
MRSSRSVRPHSTRTVASQRSADHKLVHVVVGWPAGASTYMIKFGVEGRSPPTAPQSIAIVLPTR